MKHLLWLLMAGVLACGCGTAQTVTLSGTGVQPPTPALTLNTKSIAFGNVFLGQQATQSVDMTSTGTAPVVISAITLSGAPTFSLSALPAIPDTLAPQASAQFSVTFNPLLAGPVTGAVTITSNASSSPVQSVTVTGSASAAVVALSWQAPPAGNDPAVSYNVYRGAHGSGIYTQINAAAVTATSYSDATVIAGANYDYVVKSVDAAGAESLPSNVWNSGVIP